MVIMKLILHLIYAFRHKLKKEINAYIRSPQGVHDDLIQLMMRTPLVNRQLLTWLKVTIFVFFYATLFVSNIVSDFDGVLF